LCNKRSIIVSKHNYNLLSNNKIAQKKNLKP
jgi:hypothetical protein